MSYLNIERHSIQMGVGEYVGLGEQSGSSCSTSSRLEQVARFGSGCQGRSWALQQLAQEDGGAAWKLEVYPGREKMLSPLCAAPGSFIGPLPLMLQEQDLSCKTKFKTTSIRIPAASRAIIEQLRFRPGQSLV